MKDAELINECKATGRALNYEVQSAVDIGAGEIDVIWTRKDHANLPTSKLGFFFCPTGGVTRANAVDYLALQFKKYAHAITSDELLGGIR